MSHSVDLPAKGIILDKLRASVPASPVREQLFEAIAERLAERTYEEAAFAFVLMEIVYEHEETLGAQADGLLAASVVALTADEQLGETTLQAFSELKTAIAV